MAIDPTAAISPELPVDPGIFDGQTDFSVPEDQQPEPQILDEDGVQTALGPLSKAASKGAADFIAGLFGRTLSEARKKARPQEGFPTRLEEGKQPKIEQTLDRAYGEPEPTLPDPDPVKHPDTVVPLKEISDSVPDPDLPLHSRPDPYQRYIRPTDEEARAAWDVSADPAVREELLRGGLVDFNENRIVDDAGVHERIALISKNYAGTIDEAKRGEISHAAVKNLADLIGWGGSDRKLAAAILGRKEGQIIQLEGHGAAETIQAARDLVVTELRKLDALADIARTGNDTDAMAFRYQFEFVANLMRNLKGSQTELARALSSMRNPASGRPGMGQDVLGPEAARRSQRELTDMLSGFGGGDEVRKMADMYLGLAAPHKKTSFIRGATKVRAVTDALYEVWQHALLTAIPSQIKNLLGNTITIFVSDASLTGAATIGTARRALGGQGGATFGDLNARVFGQVMSVRTALRAAGQAFVTGKSVLPGSKIDSAQRDGRRHVAAFSGEAIGDAFNVQNNIFIKTIDTLGSILTLGRVAFRTLEAGDTFFKTVAAEGMHYEQAFSAGRARNLKGDDLVDFIADFIVDPPQYAIERNIAEARYISLQKEFDVPGKALKTLVQTIPGLRWFVPFLRTPYNMFKWSFIDHTPLGLFWGDTKRMMDLGGAQRDEAYSRIAIGTTFGMLTAIETWGGNITGWSRAGFDKRRITGGGPVNPAERRTERRLGVGRYAFRVGDTYYSYAGMEPFSSTIGLWADVGEIIASGHLDKEEDKQELIAAVIAGTAYNMTNKSFMQGFATMIEMMSDPTRYSKSAVDNFMRSVVPRFVTQMERVHDPVMREARSYVDEIKAQIPGLSETLLPRVDLWGRDAMMGIPTPGGGSNLAWGPDIASPIFLSKYKENPVDLELRRMRVHLTPPDDTLKLPQMEEPLRLTDDERYFYQRRTGEIAFKELSKLIESPKYARYKKQSEKGNKLVTERLVLRIRGVHRTAKDAALRELLTTSDLRQPLRDRITQILKLEHEEKLKQGNIQ